MRSDEVMGETEKGSMKERVHWVSRSSSMRHRSNSSAHQIADNSSYSLFSIQFRLRRRYWRSFQSLTLSNSAEKPHDAPYYLEKFFYEKTTKSWPNIMYTLSLYILFFCFLSWGALKWPLVTLNRHLQKYCLCCIIYVLYNYFLSTCMVNKVDQIRNLVSCIYRVDKSRWLDFTISNCRIAKSFCLSRFSF